MKENITVKRTLKLLQLVAESNSSLSFGFLRENLYEVTPASLSRLLKELLSENWLIKDQKGFYKAGPIFYRCAEQFSQSITFSERIRPAVERLAEISGHSVTYVEYKSGGIYHRVKKEMEDSMHYAQLNHRNQRVLYNTMGRLCLAWQDRSEIERVFRLAGKEESLGDGLTYKSSVDNDSIELIESYRDFDILVSYELEMRSRICTALVRDGQFQGVLGITVPGSPLSEREEVFFRHCLKKTKGKI